MGRAKVKERARYDAYSNLLYLATRFLRVPVWHSLAMIRRQVKQIRYLISLAVTIAVNELQTEAHGRVTE